MPGLACSGRGVVEWFDGTAPRRIDSWQAAGERVVFTNGVFDILHVGHTRYLREARGLGDRLVVGINSDDSVRRLKGPTRPINSELDRAEVMASLHFVDGVTIFTDDTNKDGIINPAKDSTHVPKLAASSATASRTTKT